MQSVVKKASIACVLCLVGGGQGFAVEYVPVMNMSIQGGQYFMEGSRGNVNANALAIVAPVVKTSKEWSFIPLYMGEYQGTKGITDGVGAGTLYQQRMDHRASFAAVHNPAATTWKLKPSMSYKREFLKETRDESWGHGLFDYEKIGLGLEAENQYREPFSYRLGFDFYRIRFPNYQSLESSAGTDPQGNPLGRELSSRNVLNSYNYQLSGNVTLPYPYEEPKMSFNAGYSFLYQEFSDQRLVTSNGQFTGHKPFGRMDFLQSLSLSATYPRPVSIRGRDFRLDSGFAANFAYNGSNQNTYDAARTKYVPDAYSYYSFGFGPSLRLAWGDKRRPAWAAWSLRYGRTQYLGRLTQDGDGVYSGDHQYQDRFITGLTYAYPMAPNFYLKAQTNLLWARSNQHYEKTYSYNYRTANYLMGFTYEY